MTLSQALKQKNRMAGELVRLQNIFQRENARRSDSVSAVDREKVWDNIFQVSRDLGELKGKISKANIGIYSKIERMAEYKSRIAFVNSLMKKDGEERVYIGAAQTPEVYTWNSFINQETADQIISELQENINNLQDEIDIYNASTSIED